MNRDYLETLKNPDLFIAKAGEAELNVRFLRFARERYSVRQFSQRPIEDEKLAAILTAGQIAPTAVNFQPQKIYVLQSKSALEKIRNITKSTYDAPAVLLVCADTSKSWHSHFDRTYESGESDAAIVCTHMMLEAWEQGIGSVWVLLFDPKIVSNAFHLPKNIRPVCLLPLGYPAENAQPYRPWHDVFRPISDTVELL